MHGGGRWTIGKIAGQFDISVRTIRFYEQRGLLAPGPCADARRYDTRDSERLKLILKAKRMGFSLSDIARIVDRLGQSPDQMAPADRARTAQRLDQQIEALSARRDQTQRAIDELSALLVTRDRDEKKFG